jgi:hypothetical protein
MPVRSINAGGGTLHGLLALLMRQITAQTEPKETPPRIP